MRQVDQGVKYDFRPNLRHEVQLTLYYTWFEITEFSQNQFIDQVADLLKNGNKKAFTTQK